MSLYKYRAKDGPENIIAGKIEAKSKEEAIAKVNQMGYVPVQVEEEDLKATLSFVFPNKVKSRDITNFSRQLASFVKSGMPIVRAFTIISEQTESPYLKDVLENIRSELRDGRTLSSALANYPRLFSSFYIAMVRGGENSGALQEVLLTLADYGQKQQEIISRVRMALVYPAVMACVATGTIIFMFVFVMPRMTRIFSSIGEDLPAITKFLITISNGLRSSWTWILLAIAIMFFIVKRKSKTGAIGTAISRLRISLPIFGKLALRAELARFSRTLELLMKNGILILKAIELAIPTVNNGLIREELRRSQKDLAQGDSFGKSLKKSMVFPSFMTNLLIMGEESGNLEEALSEIANSYERETAETVKTMTTLLEPVIILVMGVIVGLIVIAMLLPVFQLNLMVR